MSENKTKPTDVTIESFLNTVSELRRDEAMKLIDIIQKISNYKPVMWGSSIIGFGSKHYKYETGREGDMPELSFSPRKSAITIYFIEGFNQYGQELKKLGKYKNSVSCLYVNKLSDIDLDVLKIMLEKSFSLNMSVINKIQTVEEYIASVPQAARPMFDELRSLVIDCLPQAKEAYSYGIIGYKIDDKRARVFISGWKDHVAVYPIPKNELLRSELKPYIKGKGTLWFYLEQPLPMDLIKRTVLALSV